MSCSLLGAFWGVSILFVITPGVDWAYAIASGIHGKVVSGVSGMLMGHLAATVIVAAGVAVSVASSEAAMSVLTAIGAVYLLGVGIKTLRHPIAVNLDGETVPSSTAKLFTRGIGVSLLNPKVFLLFLALLPQFVSPQASWPIGVQMVVLGVVHVANCAVIYCAVGFGAATIVTKHPRAARTIGIVSGIAMMTLAVTLLAELAVSQWP